MNRATYPNACPSHLRSKSSEGLSCQFIMRSQVEVIGNCTTYPHSCSSWMKDSERHQRIKPERDYDTPTTITKVESTLDKRKDTRAINVEAGRYNQT